MGFFDNLSNSIKKSLTSDINDLMKGDGDAIPDIPQQLESNKETIGQKAIIADPWLDNVNQSYLYRSRISRVSNKLLKDVSIRDWLCSAIIQARCDTMLRFARPQRKNLDMGFKIAKKDLHSPLTTEDREIMANIEDYIYNCGRRENTPPGEEMLFGEFLKLCTRDALTFGHVAVEKVLTRDNSLHRFRPVPAESMYIVNPNTPKAVVEKEFENARRTYQLKVNSKGGNNPEADREYNFPDVEYFKYMQLSYDNRVLAAFGEEDMAWTIFNAQNFADGMGYGFSPVELCISNLTNHLNVEGYNCFPARTAHILMADGTAKFIEDIVVGEQVISHDGTVNDVTHIFAQHSNKDLVTLKPIGMMEIKATEEHPILIIDRKEFRGWKEFGKPFKTQWRTMADVKKGDCVLIPRIHSKNEDFYFDMAQYADIINEDGTVTFKNRLTKYGNSTVSAKLLINDELGWLLGLYAADGCVHNNHSIRIDLHKDEQFLVDKIFKICNDLDIKVDVRNHSQSKNCIQVYIHSKAMVVLVNDLVPGTCNNKKISNLLLDAPKSVRLNVLLGHIDGDGYISSSNNDISASSGSYDLALSLSNIANSCGFLLKIKEVTHPSPFKEHTQTIKYNLLYPRQVWQENNISILKGKPAQHGVNPFYHVHDNYFIARVSKLNRESFDDVVYNIEVENTNTYVVNQIVAHNCQFFTQGYAARGILHLKGNVTQAQLTAFRHQFYNTITGTQNAWRTPMIAGIDEVQWVPLSGSAKEMEYLQYNNHIMRAICSQFQIDPLELGLDYLISATGRGGMQQASNEFKINYSRERGLIPILMMFEDMINGKILPSLDKELARMYEFKFTGYDDESPQTFVANLQAEMTVYSSMNDLLRAAQKEAIKHPVGDLPLNQSFWDLVNSNLTKGEVREIFFGDKTAVGRRDLAYFANDQMYLQWNQQLMALDTNRLQQKLNKQQYEIQDKQAQQQQEQHDSTMDQQDSMMDQQTQQQAHQVVSASRSLYDSAKAAGMATHGQYVGGQLVANPINKLKDQ